MVNEGEEKEKVFKNNNIVELKSLNDYNSDFFINSIENGATIEIVEFLLINSNFKSIDFVFSGKDGFYKTPLSLAIERNNFRIAELLIDYGANINDIPVTTFLFNQKNLMYILSKGISNEFLQKLIIQLLLRKNENSNVCLKRIFNYYIFDNAFILKLLSFYKNKTQLSSRELNTLIVKEKGKIEINKNMYRQAVYNNNFESINTLYSNDLREPDVILKEFTSLFDIGDMQCHSIDSKEFINKFKSKELNISVDNIFLDILNQFHQNRETLLSYKEIRNKLELLICQNNIGKLKNYIETNHVQMFLFSKNYSPHDDDDILLYAINKNVSLKMLQFLIQHLQCQNLDYIVHDEKDREGTLLSFALSQNKLNYCDVLIKMGAKLNTKSMDMLMYLYGNKLLNNKNLLYILNKNEKVELDSIHQMVVDNQIGLLKNLFKFYVFGNHFILKFLYYYKNKTKLLNREIRNEILWEQNKLRFSDVLYESAVESNNFEILNLLYNNDNRPKDIILDELFHILDTAELNREGVKQEFLYSIKNGILKLPVSEHYLYNLCHIETIRKSLLEIIQSNDIDSLKHYISTNQIALSNINNDYFDILIFAIKQNASIEIIKHIIPYYKTLDYTIHKYESPLFCAIYNDKFSIVHLLLKKGANFNFIFNSLGIFYKRYKSKFY
ncbi:hypothetical protein BCR36DRAFT_439349, partial [Piromyces finnis]